jgi:hypothetical protein
MPQCHYCHAPTELGGDGRFYNPGSELRHHCEPPEPPIWKLCFCHAQILVFPDGTKQNLDGKPHHCQPVAHTQQTWVTRKPLVTPPEKPKTEPWLY